MAENAYKILEGKPVGKCYLEDQDIDGRMFTYIFAVYLTISSS
jgi:hypothetical protein